MKTQFSWDSQIPVQAWLQSPLAVFLILTLHQFLYLFKGLDDYAHSL